MDVYINLLGRGILGQWEKGVGGDRTLIYCYCCCCRLNLMNCLDSLEEQTCDMWVVEWGIWIVGCGLWVVGCATGLRSKLRSHITYGGGNWKCKKGKRGKGGGSCLTHIATGGIATMVTKISEESQGWTAHRERERNREGESTLFEGWNDTHGTGYARKRWRWKAGEQQQMRKSAYTFSFVREWACDFVLAKYRTVWPVVKRECQREHSVRESESERGQAGNVTD